MSTDTSINVSGFYIIFRGAPSVGIFPSEWKISGDFSFDSETDMDRFKSDLINTWEQVSDTPVYVLSFEEVDKREALFANDEEPDCEHSTTEMRRLRCTVCTQCGQVVEVLD